MRAHKLAGFALCLLASSACTVHVRLLSMPAGASVERIDPVSHEIIDRCVTPCNWRFDLRPGHHAPLQVRATGYVPLEVDMLRTEGRLMRLVGGALFQKGGREVTFLMVPEHTALGSPAAGAP